VAALQHFLAEEGFASQRHVTGLFGPPTAAALRRWQRERGVPPSGTFGDISRLAYLHQQVKRRHPEHGRAILNETCSTSLRIMLINWHPHSHGQWHVLGTGEC